MPRSGRLPELFRTENALRAVAGYNTHENFSRRQYGGTFQLTFDSLAARVVDTGIDDRGLGRYAWTKQVSRALWSRCLHHFNLRPMQSQSF
jgi:hypothetical protein